jgi:nucleotide-binding universal stress UspA family protein
MGSYGHQPLIKAVLGSTVDRVLRMAWFPVLICR